jgi:pseudaminic acid cytidylyltransferase
MTSSIAIIPARGGSKRIPNKNVRLFLSKPIISYSVAAALETKLFDRVVVSTDSSEVAAVAAECGAEVPFTRPSDISRDETPLIDVLLHALEYFQTNERYQPDYLCCILATAPMIRASDLTRGYEILTAERAPAAISVSRFGSPILRALQFSQDGTLQMVWPEYEMVRSNQLPDFCHDAGQFYWLQCGALVRERRVFMEGARGVMLPRHLVQDIDTPEDWENAERMFAAAHQSAVPSN